MTTAREEAEKWYPYHSEVGAFNAVRNDLNVARQTAFVLGAEWQSRQPVEITGEMVERAALAGLNSERRRHGLDERGTLDDFDNQTAREWRADARISLEAALGGEA